jgi:AcrR family transcriptional regulator
MDAMGYGLGVSSFGRSNGGKQSMAALGNVRARGVATQTRILERAVHIASVEGLSQMSLATLAKATSMSKSGLFAHFRSKEALQLAIIDEAERMFRAVVVTPAEQKPAGLGRLHDLGIRYVEYAAGDTFEGGCFFAAAAHEFDSKPGPIRDRILAFLDGWYATLKTAAQGALDKGQAQGPIDLEQLTFDFTGIGLSTNWSAHLYTDHKKTLAAGRRAMDGLVRRMATQTGLSFLPERASD